jgi:PAS domain S-box-containing protein
MLSVPFFPMQSIGTLLLSGGALCAGTVFLLFYARRRRPVDLSFALCSLMVGFYDLFCSLTYAAPTHAFALAMMQGQWVCLSGAFFYFRRFSLQFLGMPAARRSDNLWAGGLGVFALIQVFNSNGSAWDAHAVERVIFFPGTDMAMAFHDFKPGWATQIQVLLCLGLALWMFMMAWRQVQKGERQPGLGMMGAMGALLLAGANDALVMSGLYSIPYLFDYSFSGVLLLTALFTARDLADSVQMRESLRTTEERFRHLESNAQEVIWELNQYGSLRYVSPKVEQLTGWKAADVLGSMPWEVLPSEMQHKAEMAWKILSAAGQGMQAVEVEVPHRKGHGIVLELSCYPVRDSQGILRGWRGLMRDITARRSAETAAQGLRQRKGLAALAESLGHDFGKLAGQGLSHCESALKLLPKDNPARPDVEAAGRTAHRAEALARKMGEMFRKG